MKLYHGTSTRNQWGIVEHGLIPEKRRLMVSNEFEPEVEARRRYFPNPVLYLTAHPRRAKQFAQLRAAYDVADYGARVPFLFSDGTVSPQYLLKLSREKVDHSEPLIVEVDVPASIILGNDPMSPLGEDFVTEQAIPPSQIIEVLRV